MKEIEFRTKDRIKIKANLYEKGNDSVVIIAPGWCMTKDSNAFVQISEMFFEKFDVISFDFRGHGRSSGFYTFTAKEVLDMDVVVKYAQEKYKKIYIAGFSLGAAVAILYAAKNRVDKLIAVSAPSDFSKIENEMYKKEAWAETFKKFELSRFLSIRPDVIPHKKEKPIDYIKQVNCPILFLAGEKDPTVHFWHTEHLFNEACGEKKYKCYENGCHAEDLFLHFKDEFKDACLNFLFSTENI